MVAPAELPLRAFVTRPLQDAQPWVEGLRALGCHAQALPLIDIGPAPVSPGLERILQSTAAPDVLMFVSANAARHFFQHPLRIPGPLPTGTRCWAPGPGTAQCLQQLGVPPTQIDQPLANAAQFDSESLWAVVAPQVHDALRVCIVRGSDGDAREQGQGQGREWLRMQLQAAGAQVSLAASYTRQPPVWSPATRQHAQAAATDGTWWLFSSAQAIRHLQALLPAQSWAQARAVTTHPRIAQAARAAGFGVLRECTPSLQAVMASIESPP